MKKSRIFWLSWYLILFGVVVFAGHQLCLLRQEDAAIKEMSATDRPIYWADFWVSDSLGNQYRVGFWPIKDVDGVEAGKVVYYKVPE